MRKPIRVTSCRFRVFASELSLPSHFQVVASELSLPSCLFRVVASSETQGTPGADSGGERKSKWATKKTGEERALDFSSPVFFVARLDFPSTPPSAPEFSRMELSQL